MGSSVETSMHLSKRLSLRRFVNETTNCEEAFLLGKYGMDFCLVRPEVKSFHVVFVVDLMMKKGFVSPLSFAELINTDKYSCP